jgi:hypothetical protein
MLLLLLLLLLLFTVREYTLRCWGGLQRHNFHTKFRENLLFQILNWRNTHTHAPIEHGDLTSLYVYTLKEGK